MPTGIFLRIIGFLLRSNGAVKRKNGVPIIKLGFQWKPKSRNRKSYIMSKSRK